MKSLHTRPAPSLARRALELRHLNLDEATIKLHGGRLLTYDFSISPGRYGRLYDCRLELRPGESAPRMFVMHPDLVEVAGGKKPPHLYNHDGPGRQLCLWWPKNREWDSSMKLASTYIAWTAEWLWYYEQWLKEGSWLAGGAHPVLEPRRWNPHRHRETSSMQEDTSFAASTLLGRESPAMPTGVI